ncbi:MAG: S8 family peptidase [Planctomycetota bacterium]
MRSFRLHSSSFVRVSALAALVTLFGVAGSFAQSITPVGPRISGGPVSGGPGGAPPPMDYFRTYFDAQQNLDLDLNRIAAFEPSASLLAAAADAEAQGAGPVIAWPIAGWWLLPVPIGERSAAGIEALILGIAKNVTASFATPIFVGSDGGPLFPTRDLLMRFDASTDRAAGEALLAAMIPGQVLNIDFGTLTLAYRIRLDTRSGFEALALANALASARDVRFSEPDWIFTGRTSGYPSDPFFPLSWGLDNTGQGGGIEDIDIDAPETWDAVQGSAEVRIVILDCGIDPVHEDLHQLPGADFTGSGLGGAPGNECDRHGTAVAGCIAMMIDNDVGSVGVAPECPVLSARMCETLSLGAGLCGTSWTSQSSWSVEALVWASFVGAAITVNSNAYGVTSAAIDDIYSQTSDIGMMHFASSGNDGLPIVTYPASLATVYAVGAIDASGELAWFSNHGPELDYVGPGVDIYTSDLMGAAGYSADSYVTVDGTSYAAPHVAGIAALLWSLDSTLTTTQLAALLSSTATDLGPIGWDESFGAGLPNAWEAIATLVEVSFRRGDSNGDGLLDIADAITLLTHLFSGGLTSCPLSMDANDDDAVDIGDAIYLLFGIFGLGPTPIAPGLSCGADPTPGGLDCTSYSCN